SDNRAYDEALVTFVERSLGGSTAGDFLASFRPLQARVARAGMHNSLSQLVLKLASPGVPDFYQGSELWDLSLVDPDNRRPVDYELRRQILDELRGSSLAQAELARKLYESWPDGRIKLFLTHAGLQARKALPDAFAGGGYVPLSPEGARAGNLAAFARTGPDGQMAVVA